MLTLLLPLAVASSTLDNLRGTARNAKGGAIVLNNDGVTYISGLRSWPASVDGEPILLEGTVKIEHYLPAVKVSADGAYSQGVTQGDIQEVLHLTAWCKQGSALCVEPGAWRLEITDTDGNLTKIWREQREVHWLMAPIAGPPRRGVLTEAQILTLWGTLQTVQENPRYLTKAKQEDTSRIRLFRYTGEALVHLKPKGFAPLLAFLHTLKSS